MSKAFQRFVDNFLKGAMLGTHWIQMAQQADDRKEQRAIARERNRIAAANHAERMALERTKLGGTQELQRAQADWYRRRSAGGGGGGPSGGAQQFINEMGNAGIDLSAPTPRQTQAVQQEEPPMAVPEATPAEEEGYARGGRVRGRQIASALMSGAQRGIGAMNRPLPSPGAEPPGIRPVGPQGSGVGGAYTPQDTMGRAGLPPMNDAGISGPGSGFGQRAAPPVGTAPMQASPPTEAIDLGYGMDMVARGGRIRGPKRPHVPRFASGGQVIPDDYVDDPSLSPEERQRRWKDALFPSGQRQRDFEASLPPPGYPGDSAGHLRNQWREQGDLERDRRRQTLSGRQSPFMGETDRADETVMRDPGETGGQPMMPSRATGMSTPEQDYPTNTAEPEGTATSAGGKGPPSRGGGGGRGGAALDTGQWKGLGDQSRTAAYDPVRDAADPRNVGAVDREGRTQPWVNQRVTMDDKGQVARIDNPATDYTSGAAAYATALGKEHPMAVYNGAGSADPRMMDMLMKGIDPEGKMPVAQRMETATKLAHEFYMQQGDPAAANQVAGEITQYGVQQSRVFGVNAMKLLQQGDMQGAVQQLIQGYDHLPNGQHATVQGNQIVVVDNRGKPVMNIPLDPKTVQNLAFGMLTGKLGWDAMGYAPQPPTAARSAAQPSAAPAGPQAPTPAAPIQAVQTTAPATPPTVPRAGATSPPTAQQTQAVKRPSEESAPSDPDEERLRKNPRSILPGVDRATAAEPRDLQAYIDLKRQAETRYMNERKMIMQRGAQTLGKGERAYLTQALQAHKARFDAHMKEIDAEIKRVQSGQQSAEQHDVNVETRPRDVSLNDETAMTGAFDRRSKEIAADPVMRKNTVLENLKPADQKPVYDLARQIWQQNRGISMDQALNYALGVTSIKPEGEGANLGTGKDALQFRTRRNQRGGLSLELPSGEKILTDKNTFTAINNLHRKNWDAYEANRKKAEADKAERAKRGEGLFGRAGQAIMDVMPQSPFPTPLTFPRYIGK